MNEKIELYKVRDFSDRINVTFSFIKQNAKPIFKNLMYLVPVYVILGIISGIYMGSFYMNFNNVMYGGYVYGYDHNMIFSLYGFIFLIGIAAFITSLVSILFVVSYLAEYEESEDINVNTSKVWNRVKRSLGGSLGGYILITIIVCIGFMFCILPGIWLGVSLILFIPAYVAERNKEISGNVFDCIGESFNLIKQDWFGAFGYLIVVFLILFAFSFALSLPVQIFQTSMGLFHAGNTVFVVVMILSYILSNLGMLFFSSISSTAISILYYDFKERQEGLSMKKKIDNIGQQNQF